MRTWNEKGRGRKKCPGVGCKIYIPVRANDCPICGFDLAAARREEKRELLEQKRKLMEEAPLPEVQEIRESKPSDVRPFLIVAPGKCPVELTSTSVAEVQFWVDDIKKINRIYQVTTTCLRHYARQFFDFRSEEYKKVASIINSYRAIHETR